MYILKQLFFSISVNSGRIFTSPQFQRIIVNYHTLNYHTLNYLVYTCNWPKVYIEFLKSAPVTLSSCRLYNNHVKYTHGHV